MPYINQRWLGGLLTNWVTVQKSVKRLQELDEMATDGRYELLTKKEVIRLERERKHLQANLAGIKNMKRLPDALFVVDSNNEAIAVKEARKLGIPVVAVVDTNCDPDRGRLRDSGQRRRAARHSPVHLEDRRFGGRRREPGGRQGVRRGSCRRRRRCRSAEAHVGRGCRFEPLLGETSRSSGADTRLPSRRSRSGKRALGGGIRKAPAAVKRGRARSDRHALPLDSARRSYSESVAVIYQRHAFAV